MTPVQEAVAEYLAHGWKVCRIGPGSKGPREEGWNLKGHEIRTPEAFPLQWGVGLLHAWSGTMALDIDNYPVARTFLEARGVDLDALLAADDAVQIVSGRVNSAKLLYACEPRVGVSCADYDDKDKNGKPIVKKGLDFRCMNATGNSQQDVLPPSIHPGRGQPYVWQFGVFADWRVLPPIPDFLSSVWDALSAPLLSTTPQAAAPFGAAHSDIERWLATQDAGMTRGDWVKVGMKLHAEFQGSMAGFEMWQRWSATSTKWDEEAQRNMLPIWKGFKLEGRALATLEHDIRTLPAQPEEFAAVTPSEDPKTLTGTVAEIQMAAEGAAHRENRELMQNHVVLLTSAAAQYYLLPGHPNPKLARAAGHAGVDLNFNQFNALMAPYMRAVTIRKTVMKPKATDVIDNAEWRYEAARMAFKPGGKWLYEETADGHNYLNAWREIVVEPIKPRPHEIEPLIWLLKRVLDENGQPGNANVFTRWLCALYAYVLQNPGVKVPWAPLLYSKQPGTGKTTLMQRLPEILFGKNYVMPMTHEIMKTQFATAKFDSHWWVHMTEMHSDGGKVDARFLANKMKPWITDNTIQVQKKNIDAYAIQNYLQFTASSNDEDALFLEEDGNDRRWLVGSIVNQELTTEEKAMLNPLFGVGPAQHPNAAGWLKWFFLDVDISWFNPSMRPPVTMAKKRVQEHSRSLWEDKVFLAFEDGANPFDKDIVRPRDLTEGLLIGQRVTLSQARRLLQKIGAVEMRSIDSDRSLFSVRHHGQWANAKPSAVKAHLSSGFRHFDPNVDDGTDLL